MSDLTGRGVAVTRAEDTRGPLSRLLASRGARVVDWAAIRYAPPEDPRPLERAFARLDGYDWLVLTSGRAVAALTAMTVNASSRPATLRVAAVGTATAAELEARGWRVDRIGEGPGAAALVEAFAAAGDAAGARVLFPASSQARPVLAEGLAKLGAAVDRIEAYRTLPTALDAAACRRDVAAGHVDAALFASPSALAGLVGACGDAALAELLAAVAVVSIGPTTSAALAERGRTPDAEASPSTFEGLVDAVARLLAEPRFRDRAASRAAIAGGTR